MEIIMNDEIMENTQNDDNKEITLTDLFDVDMLQRIQDAFSNMTGLAAIITDANGIPVTKGANFTTYCTSTRNTLIGSLRCQQCDKCGAELALKVGSSVTYYCHAGLMDFAAPIMAGDNMIGCFVGGQVLTDIPDITKVMQVAGELDIDLIGYLQAVMRVRVLNKKRIESDASFLYTLTDALSSIAYHKFKMKEANIAIERVANMKSDFLANMSHELRTPMNAVLGMTEMALREDMSPTARQYLNQIKASGKTLLTIINDILDFSKIESGKMDIIEADFDPLSLIYDLSSIIVTRIDTDDTEFILDINPNIPRMLYGDSNRIKQVIINLANNAAKFTRQGKVELKFDFEQIDTDKMNLLFSVKDTGIGIKEQDIEKIFQSFQQVDSKRNRNIEGTGLGLVICKQLLELMNGDMSVESVYQKGSCFSFTLPLIMVDKRPALTIENESIVPAFGHLKNQYANKRLIDDMQNLGIHYTDLADLSDLSTVKDLLSSNIDQELYLFVDADVVTEELLHIVEKLPKVKIVLVVNPGESVQSPIPNAVVIKKPVSAMMVSAIYNDEEYSENLANDVYYNFTAETAHILIVDDNIVNLTVAEGLLEPLNMQIDTATSGSEAIEKISKAKYDLILMDHMMPELDGVETTHIIRRFHKEYAEVPIIALTANAVSEAKRMFIAEGMNDFIAKPIEMRVLMGKIYQWLPKHKITKAKRKHITETECIIPKVEGIDTDSAIELLGSQQAYESILKEYFRIIPQKSELIRQYLEKEDWKNYTIEVHALKSTSRQIGAIGLSIQAECLENAGNVFDLETIRSQTGTVLSEYQCLYERLKPYFEESNHPLVATKELTDDVLKNIFNDMEHAIEELDIDLLEKAVHRLDTYKLNDLSEIYYNKMCSAVDDMDSYACEDIMQEWREMLNKEQV